MTKPETSVCTVCGEPMPEGEEAINQQASEALSGISALHDDSEPELAGLSRLINDGSLPDSYRRIARAAYDRIAALGEVVAEGAPQVEGATPMTALDPMGLEAASKAVVAEWKAMLVEFAEVSPGDIARGFVSPGNHRLLTAGIAAYLAASALDRLREERDAARKLVEQSYRDGLTYASNVMVTPRGDFEAFADEAWRTSRARAALSAIDTKGGGE